MKQVYLLVMSCTAALLNPMLYGMENMSLIRCAEENEWSTVERMLSEGADPCQTDQEGKSLLSYWIPLTSRRSMCVFASDKEREERLHPERRIARLLEKGVRLTQADVASKASILHKLACYYPPLIAQAVTLQANLVQMNKKGEIPLRYCLRYITGVSKYNKHGCDQDEQDKRELRVLEGIQALVKAGTDIHSVWEEDKRNHTVLSRALYDGRSAFFIKKLLELGAHPDLPAELYSIPLVQAFRHKQVNEIVELLLAHKANPNLIPYIAVSAARFVDDQTLTFLLSKGMNVNVYDEAGGCGTPLTEAIQHYRGFKRWNRVLSLLEAGASAHDGCALLEAACSARKDDDQEGAIGLVGLLLALECSADSIVKPYRSLSNAMHWTSDKAPADELYEKYISVWPHGSIPAAYKRIRAMFRRAKENPRNFVYISQVLDTFKAVPRLPVMSTSACMCKSMSCEDMQEPADRDIIYGLQMLIENSDKDQTQLYKKDLFSKILPSVEGMVNKAARTCALYNMLRTSIANLDTFGKTYRRSLFKKLLENSDLAFTCHASNSKDDTYSDLILRLIKTAHKKRAQLKKSKISSKFSKLMKRKPEAWQPSWRHIVEALKAQQAGVPFYLKALIPYCNLNAYGSEGQTVLHALVSAPKIDVKLIGHVLDKGADPNVPDMSRAGDTALHHALHADIWAFDNTPNDVSIRDLERAKNKCIELLITRGAIIRQPNIYGQTPEDIMKEKEHKKALKKGALV